MIWKPAEPGYWDLFGQLRADAMRSMALRKAAHGEREEYRTGGLSLSPPYFTSGTAPAFALADA